jgi:hypothetical protein
MMPQKMTPSNSASSFQVSRTTIFCDDVAAAHELIFRWAKPRKYLESFVHNPKLHSVEWILLPDRSIVY